MHAHAYDHTNVPWIQIYSHCHSLNTVPTNTQINAVPAPINEIYNGNRGKHLRKTLEENSRGKLNLARTTLEKEPTNAYYAQ